MKKNSLFFYSIAMLLLFMGCKSEDDGLTTDSFKTKATLQGNVYYSLGQDFIEGKYLVDKRVKASGKTIYLDVQSSEYKPGSTGVITYTAKVDTAGNYTFTVPVKAQGSTVGTIRLEQFTEKRQIYDQMVAGTPTFTSEQAVFSFTKSISLSNGSLNVENISYGFSPVNIPTTYKDYITLKGTLNLAYEKGFRDGALKAASGQSVEISVNYPTLGNMHFGTTVDQNGSYSIQIPVSSRKNALNASVQVLSFVTNDYTFYASSTDQTKLKGIYACSAPETINTLSGMNDIVEYTVAPMTMYFSPFAVPSAWVGYDLAGWVQLDPTIYKYPVTLTGNVLAAIEKSYLVGDYAPSAGRTVKVTVNMGTGYATQSYIVSTDNAGKYTIPIQVPQKNMTVSVSVSTDTYGVSNYTHYMADGTSTQLNGWYKTSYYDITNLPITISEFYTTYTIDNLYRVFQPENTNSVKNWNSNLFGWYRIVGYRGSIAISGTVKQAVEGAPNTLTPAAWATATWSNSANQPFTISVGGGKSLIGITNSLGQYSLAFPVNFAVGSSLIYAMNITVASSIENVIDFNHYSSIDTVTPTPIQGRYSGTTSTYNPYANNVVVNCYMFFSPTTIPAGWSSYSWLIN